MYGGLPIVNWIFTRVQNIVIANRTLPAGIVARHSFVSPVEFEFSGQAALISGIDLRFSPETKWFSHIVTIDATLGIYDYIRGRVRLAPGEDNNSYMIHGVNIYDGTPR